ncbi:MAG: NUDIX domain-containing protein [Jiangellales bacterium]
MGPARRQGPLACDGAATAGCRRRIDCGCGGRHWGRLGAAGLLVLRGGDILLQHRAPFLQEGGTWAVLGGALDEGESPVMAALREAEEEAGIRPTAVRNRHAWAVDHGDWAYTTVVADAIGPINARNLDGEGLAVQWVPVSQVPTLALHSGFAAAWPLLRGLLGRHEAVIIGSDAAHLDAVGAALAAASEDGLATPSLLLDVVPGRTRAWPTWEVSTTPARRGDELVQQGWQVTVLSDDSSVRADLTHHGLRVVGSAAMIAEEPESWAASR